MGLYKSLHYINMTVEDLIQYRRFLKSEKSEFDLIYDLIGDYYHAYLINKKDINHQNISMA